MDLYLYCTLVVLGDMEMSVKLADLYGALSRANSGHVILQIMTSLLKRYFIKRKAAVIIAMRRGISQYRHRVWKISTLVY